MISYSIMIAILKIHGGKRTIYTDKIFFYVCLRVSAAKNN